MPDYRIFFQGADGHFRGVIEFVCADDMEATRKAEELLAGGSGELWQLNRRVQVIDTERDERPQ